MQQSIVFFLLTLALEFLPHHKICFAKFKEWWHKNGSTKHDISQSSTQPLLGSFANEAYSMSDEDVDVRVERQRILSGSADNAVINLHNLRKVLSYSFLHREERYPCVYTFGGVSF